VIRVSEIFGPTIQGEGPLVGMPTVFVRTGGCDYRCSWCDTPHAVLTEHRADWHPMEAAEIADRVARLFPQPCPVTISGGNPAIQPCGDLIEDLHCRGYSVLVETQGTFAPDWFGIVDHLVLSPKPPSSGMATAFLDPIFDQVGACVQAAGANVFLKIVVMDDVDFAWAVRLVDRFRDDVMGLFLTPGNVNPVGEFDLDAVLSKTRWLVGKVLAGGHADVRVIPQVHTLLWGNQRGV